MSPTNVGLTNALPCLSVTDGPRLGASPAAVTNLTHTPGQPIKVFSASVTLKSFRFLLACTLPRKRIAELVHRAMEVTLAGLASVTIKTLEKFKSEIAAIASKPWKQNTFERVKGERIASLKRAED